MLQIFSTAIALSLITFSQFANASGPIVIKSGGCSVMSYTADGNDVEILKFSKVTFDQPSKTEIYRDNDRIFTALTAPNHYNSKPALELYLKISDAKSGAAVADSVSVWYVGSPVPPIMVVGTADAQTGNKYVIQCMQD